MQAPTYQAYRADPAIRARIEREARRARHAAVGAFIVAPVVRVCRRALRRDIPPLVRALRFAFIGG